REVQGDVAQDAAPVETVRLPHTRRESSGRSRRAKPTSQQALSAYSRCEKGDRERLHGTGPRLPSRQLGTSPRCRCLCTAGRPQMRVGLYCALQGGRSDRRRERSPVQAPNGFPPPLSRSRGGERAVAPLCATERDQLHSRPEAPVLQRTARKRLGTGDVRHAWKASQPLHVEESEPAGSLVSQAQRAGLGAPACRGPACAPSKSGREGRAFSANRSPSPQRIDRGASACRSAARTDRAQRPKAK